MLICHRCNRRNCKTLYWSDYYESDVCSVCFVNGLTERHNHIILEAKERISKEGDYHAGATSKPMGKHRLLGVRILIRTIPHRLRKISNR